MFKDLKVIEIASVLAGPAVGMFFAELGAEVIKIENARTGGDVTRSWRLNGENSDKVSSYFASANFGKKSVFLDFTNPEDLKVLEQFLKEADIVITNFKCGDDLKFKLSYDDVKKLKTDIIYAQITGFGLNVDRVAYDLILQAETGFMSMNGTKDTGPLKMPVAFIDILAAHQLKEAILIALWKRERSKEGSFVTVSLQDSAICSLANQASNYLMNKYIPELSGSLHPNIAPYGEILTSGDKQKIVLAIGTDKQFEKLCGVLNCPELANKIEFSTNSARVKHREQLFEKLQDAFINFTASYLLKQFNNFKIPCGQIKNLEEVFSTAGNQLILEENGNKAVRTIAFSTDFLKSKS